MYRRVEASVFYISDGVDLNLQLPASFMPETSVVLVAVPVHGTEKTDFTFALKVTQIEVNIFNCDKKEKKSSLKCTLIFWFIYIVLSVLFVKGSSVCTLYFATEFLNISKDDN